MQTLVATVVNKCYPLPLLDDFSRREKDILNNILFNVCVSLLLELSSTDEDLNPVVKPMLQLIRLLHLLV